MTFLQNPNETNEPKSHDSPNRLSVRLLVAGVLVAVSLSVAACGSSALTTTLNTGKLEQAIESSSLAQRGQHAKVTCPSSVPQKKGLVFTCMAVVGHVSTRFVVTEQNESGHVTYEAH